MNKPEAKKPGKVSGWFDKMTAKPAKSHNMVEDQRNIGTATTTATEATMTENTTENNAGKEEKRPASGELSARSRSGSESQHGDTTTDVDAPVTRVISAVAEATVAEKGDDNDNDGENKEYITGLPLMAVMVAVTLSAFIMLLDTSIINTALPYITSEFHSLAAVGWYLAAYQLASASLQPLTGKFYTHFKAKWTYMIFTVIFEIGSLICALANSSNMLIGGRAMAGIGASGLMNGGMTIIAGAVPLQKRPLYTGILLGCSQIGVICGPLVGGAFTQYVTWRWCFYINLPVGGLVLLLLLFIHVPDLTEKEPFTLDLVRRTIPELDLVGFVLFAPATIMCLLALQWGNNEYPWNSSVIIGLFCGAAATAVVFVVYESHVGAKAMIPGAIVRQRVVYSSAANGMGLMGSIFVASQYLPIYFQGVKGVGPAMSGVDLLPSILGQLFMVVVSGILVSRVGYYMPFSIACGVVTSIGCGLVSTYSPTTPTDRWVGFQLLLGLGRGMGMQMGLIAAQHVLSPKDIPVGVAFLMFCQNFAGSVLVVVATAIFDQALTTEIQTHAPSVEPAAALAAGASASAVRSLVPAGSSELAGVLLAFSNSINKVFYLCLACSAVACFSALGMGWIDTRKKRKPGNTQA